MTTAAKYYLCIISDLEPDWEPEFDPANPGRDGWIEVSEKSYTANRHEAVAESKWDYVLEAFPHPKNTGYFRGNVIAGIIYEDRDASNITPIKSSAVTDG